MIKHDASSPYYLNDFEKAGFHMNNFQDKANFVWTVADDILRGAFKQHEYGDVILPFVVLRRLDCVFENSKDAVIETYKRFKNELQDDQLQPVLLNSTNGLNFYNISRFDLQRLSQDAGNIELNFNNYVNGFSKNVYEIIENFQLDKIKTKLVKNGLLFMLVDRFTEVDLHPDKVLNHEMGYIFEELLRRFSEMSNETAGEHYTPREVIRLMVNLLFEEHQDELKGKGIIRTIFDPACGTGGMLTIAKEHIQQKINPDIEIVMFGQELNEQTFAIAKSDVLISVDKGDAADNIKIGSSFSQDGFKGKRFDYMLSNPPFGVSWKKEQEFIKNEANDPCGRFSAGLPRVSDGALLFQLHMLSKMSPKGSRIAIIHNGSPLFTGDAGGGESNIRKWIIENDWLEAIVALPTELFYNTGIATYIWIVTNKKPEHRKGKVQLINAIGFFKKMRKSLGNKRNYITDDQIQEITKIYKHFEEGEQCKIFDNEDFGYTKITVERPLIENGVIQKDSRGNPKPDSSLRDFEKVPLKDDIDDYFEKEVKPHVPDAWMDRGKDSIGYEINFTKYFYKYQPLRSLDEIKVDILALEGETEGLLREILE
ncbi:MAG: N-6 DNA methylase [bacterium]